MTVHAAEELTVAEAWDKGGLEDEDEAPLIAKQEDKPVNLQQGSARSWKSHRTVTCAVLLVVFGLLAVHWPYLVKISPGCQSETRGYNCHLPGSHHWGQYSPYFSVESDIADWLPEQCKVTFAQVLSRHGARFPTKHKSEAYFETLELLRRNVTTFEGKYSFLQGYKYDLGSDDLTKFGEQQMIDSGSKFYKRYRALAKTQVPFFRSSSSSRVVVSAQNFTQGFHQAKSKDATARFRTSATYPYEIVVLSEAEGSNNTLDHGACAAFESGRYDHIWQSADDRWKAMFIPSIQERLNADLSGADLSMSQVVYLMDLCPFATVASEGADKLSPFCNLFTEPEWRQYDYLLSMDKYYSYGSGNPLGPSQGVGFANELIARMTGQPVRDDTSTNHTLDSDPVTFPIGNGQVLYGDFSHDTQMISIFSALGLYNATAPLPDFRMQTREEARGYSAARAVSFASRTYFEKMKCLDQEEELVRVLVNDRVIPLQKCGADALGRCKLGAWVESLSFASHNGHWDQCAREKMGPKRFVNSEYSNS